jgi:hypothetical protein
MRKLLLSVLAMIIAANLFAQDFAPKSIHKETPSAKDPIHPNGVQGTLIWETDFDGADWSGTSDNGVPVPANAPTGWSIVDNTGNNFNWRWDTVGPRGIFTSPGDDCTVPYSKLSSYSASNGFLMLESDHFNSNANCVDFTDISMDAYVQYDAGIDMSNVNGVYISFTEMNRFCCLNNESSSAFVEISVDGGTTWTSFSVIEEMSVGSGNPNYTEINLTDVAAGQNNVKFRFHQIGLTHYYWLIDDVKFIEPHDYDMAMIDYWNDYIEYSEPTTTYDFQEGFYAYPWFLVQEFKGFHAAVYNYGINDMSNVDYEVVIFKDQVIQQTYTTTHESTITSGAYDTLHMLQNWTPTETGDYIIEHNVTHSNESFIYNNFINTELNITDSILSPVDFSKVNTEISPDDWVSFDENGDGLGFKFNVPDPSHISGSEAAYYELEGFYVYVGSNAESEAKLDLFRNEEARLVVSIFKYIPETETYEEIDSYAEITLDINDTSSIAYVPWESDGINYYIFEGGEYLFAMNMYGTYTNDLGNLQSWNIMGTDESITKLSLGSYVTVNSTIETGDDVLEIYTLKGPALALELSYHGPNGIQESAEIQEINIYPNPTSSKFKISDIETGTITIKNVAGQIVYSGELSNNQVDISDQPDGMYFIEVRNGEEVHSGRVIKK